MAKAAAAYADFLVITSDNPRDEDPNAIIQDILAGLEGSTIPYEVVVDRKEAILRGMQIAQPGDVLSSNLPQFPVHPCEYAHYSEEPDNLHALFQPVPKHRPAVQSACPVKWLPFGQLRLHMES